MRMDKGAILASIAIIALASVFAGAGTMAWFSDKETEGPYIFKSGDLEISLDDIHFEFSNLAPGDAFTVSLVVRNTGSVGIQKLLFRDVNVHKEGGDLSNVIIIENIVEDWVEDGTVHHDECAGSTFEGWLPDTVANYDGDLSLKEWWTGYPPGTAGGTDYDVVTGTDNGAWTDRLLPGQWYKMTLELKFDEDAGNAYENAVYSFDIEVYATQGPISSVPGYTS